jgi:hypothetical protein
MPRPPPEQYSGSYDIFLVSSVMINPDSGQNFPSCSRNTVSYGYGLGAFVQLDDCWSGVSPNVLTRTFDNPSRALYQFETNPAKGPMPTTTFSSQTSFSIVTSDAATALSVQPGGNGTNLPAGTIAGIAVGCILVAVLGVAGLLIVRSRTRSPNRIAELVAVFRPREPETPAPVYTSGSPQSVVYPMIQQPIPMGSENDSSPRVGMEGTGSGLRIDTRPVLPAAELGGVQK